MYFGSDYNKFYALNKNDGSLRWELKTGRSVNYGAAVDEKGTVYFACKDHSCYAVDGGSGEILWKNTLTTADSATWVSGFPALGDNGLLYIGVSGFSAEGFHRLFTLDAATGHELCSFHISGNLYSSPLVHDGVLHIGSGDGFL